MRTRTQTITRRDASPPTWVTPVGSLDKMVDCNDTDARGRKPVATDNCTGSSAKVVVFTDVV